MKRVTMITGGGRCGKSRQALELARPYRRRAFIATAEAFDGEMSDRIAKHKAERGSEYLTVEAPLDLAGALRSLPGDVDVAVVDCLTVWLGNLMHRHGADGDGESLPEVAALLQALGDPPCDVIVVTNEVGMGIIPENAMARRFRDWAGRVNQRVAAQAGEVVLMVSGIPLKLK
jgi:adenosylcobinamide kinase / adenosylcobinamide-phosphate guanylyltransferase